MQQRLVIPPALSMAQTQRRLKQLHGLLQPPVSPCTALLSLPDGSQVEIAPQNGPKRILINGEEILEYRPLGETASLVLAAIGTPYEHDNPVPKYQVLELAPPEGRSSLSIPDAWAAIYALWTMLHESPSRSLPHSGAPTSWRSTS